MIHIHQGRSSYKQFQRGFSLMEFMVVIALIALVISTSIIQFQEADNMRTNQAAIEELNIIITMAKKQRDRLSGYSGISATQVASDAAFPVYMRSIATDGVTINGIDAPILGNIQIQTSGTGFEIGTIFFHNQSLCIFLGSKAIFSVDSIHVVPRSGTTRTVSRDTVVSGAAANSPARHYFDPTMGNTAAACSHPSAQRMFFYVDSI